MRLWRWLASASLELSILETNITALAVVAFKERGGRAFSLSVGIPMQSEGWWHHPLSSCALMGGGSGWEVRKEKERGCELSPGKWVCLGRLMWSLQIMSLASAFTLGPPSHPISPPNKCDCTRFSVIFCCGMPLKFICSLSARKKHLSSSPPVLLCVLKHFYTWAVFVFRLRVWNWLRVTRAPVVCRPIIITSSWHSDEARNISWLLLVLSAFHSGFVLRPLYKKSMRVVSNLESLHINVIQCQCTKSFQHRARIMDYNSWWFL